MFFTCYCCTLWFMILQVWPEVWSELYDCIIWGQEYDIVSSLLVTRLTASSQKYLTHVTSNHKLVSLSWCPFSLALRWGGTTEQWSAHHSLKKGSNCHILAHTILIMKLYLKALGCECDIVLVKASYARTCSSLKWCSGTEFHGFTSLAKKMRSIYKRPLWSSHKHSHKLYSVKIIAKWAIIHEAAMGSFSLYIRLEDLEPQLLT